MIPDFALLSSSLRHHSLLCGVKWKGRRRGERRGGPVTKRRAGRYRRVSHSVWSDWLPVHRRIFLPLRLCCHGSRVRWRSTGLSPGYHRVITGTEAADDADPPPLPFPLSLSRLCRYFVCVCVSVYVCVSQYSIKTHHLTHTLKVRFYPCKLKLNKVLGL